MPATIKPILKKEPKNDGSHLVMIRIIVNRMSTYMSAGIYIKKSDWNEKATYERGNWVRNSHLMSSVYNKSIKDKLKEAELKVFELQMKGLTVSSKFVKNRIKGDCAENLIVYFRNQVELMEQIRSNRTIERNTSTINKLIKFNKGIELSFDEINISFLKSFEAFLLKSELSINTTAKHLETFASIIKSAVNDDLIDYSKNPFLKFKIRHERTSVERLTYEEIQLIGNAEISPLVKQYHARNIFMLQFYCAGVRIGDMLSMKFKNIVDDRLIYIMGKTDKPKSIKLIPESLEILKLYEGRKNNDQYIFPFLDNNIDYSYSKFYEAQIESKTAQINGLLKALCKKLEINKNISTHKARHSFAEFARKRNIDIYTISKALSHSSIKITENYLSRFDEGAVDSALNEMFLVKQ